MFHLKGCPKCHGDLYLEGNELEDQEMCCVQCGFRKFVTPLALTIPYQLTKNPVVPIGT